MSEAAVRLHFPPLPPATTPLWVGALGPVAVWAVQMECVYGLARWACTHHHVGMLTVLNAIFLALAVIAGIVCALYRFRRSEQTDQQDRVRFLASLGILTSIIFSLLIAAQLIATIMLDPCAT